MASRDPDRASGLLSSGGGKDGETSSSYTSSTSLEVVRCDLARVDDDDDDDDLRRVMEGVNAIVISVGTTAFPTRRWENGRNTPRAIDDAAVGRIANVAAGIETLRRVV